MSQMEENCADWDLLCRGRNEVADTVGGAVGDAITNLASAVTEALGKVLASLGTLWVNVGTPQLVTQDGAPSGTVVLIRESLWFYMAGAAVLAVIVGGARMAWERRAEPGRDLVKSLLTLVVASGAGLTGIALAAAAADAFSVWIIDRSTDGTDFGSNLVTLIALTAVPTAGLGPLLVIILGLVAIVASFVQIMLMVTRGGMLVILAGILPLASSFTSTEMGRSWFKKCVGWTLAFVLYKPAAAIVYATAFRLTGTEVFGDDGSGLMDVLVGLVLMLLALFALPALMRFVTPMVSQMASGATGAVLGAGAVATLPTGAMHLAGSGGSSGIGGGSPPASASGANGASGSSAATPPAGAAGAAGTNGSNGSRAAADRSPRTEGAAGSGPGGAPSGGTGAGPGGAPSGGTGAGPGGAPSGGTGAGEVSAPPPAGAGGTAGTSAAGGAASGAAAAAGPAGAAAAVAGQALAAGKAGADGVRRAAQDATDDGEGPSGSQ